MAPNRVALVALLVFTGCANDSVQQTEFYKDIIPIRNTDPPDLLALFPHYFSEEVVP